MRAHIGSGGAAEPCALAVGSLNGTLRLSVGFAGSLEQHGPGVK
jgi:hypothetical protein